MKIPADVETFCERIQEQLTVRGYTESHHPTFYRKKLMEALEVMSKSEHELTDEATALRIATISYQLWKRLRE